MCQHAAMQQTRLVLVRHGETAWSRSGRHTGRTDVALTEAGEAEARLAGTALDGWAFDAVTSSPLQRAVATASLAGFKPQLDDDLMEWDYGEVEGHTNDTVQESRPGWSKWLDEMPAGEQVADVGDRADSFLQRIGSEAGDVVAFAHGHLLAVMIARWAGLGAAEGRRFPLATGSVTVLGWKRDDRVLVQFNHSCHSEITPA
jgi:broad specificity phosphatase PhoE